MTLTDALIRETALDPHQSFIVEAPAGSGKTELLVKRFLALLKTVENPESILAITFTRKAATEMKERIMHALTEIGSVPDFWEERLRIMTIDAFCKEITATAPVQNNLFAADMIEDPAALRAAFLESLLQVIEEREEGSQDLIALFQYFDNQLEETAALLFNLLQNREEWLPLVLRANSDLQSSIAALYAEIETELAAEKLDIETVKSQIPLLFTQKLELRKRVAADLKPLIAKLADSEHLHDLYLRVAHLPPLDFVPHAILPILLRLLPLSAAHLKIVLEQRNETDFHEIALAALGLLQDETKEVLRRLDAQIKHILIDEFQDTSNLQFQLLKLLIQDWTAGDGRTLFLVGDPKQSIYRFRNAEVGLFLEAKHRGIGALKLQALQLSQNFRSQAPLLDWINQSCMAFFPKVEDEYLGKVKYVKSSACVIPAKAGIQPPVTQAFFEDEQGEANWIAEEIRLLQQNHPQDKIAILVRARSHYETLISVLETAALPYAVTDDKRWQNSVFLDDLISLLYAVCQPQDRLAWFALLRSPFCNWSLQRIYDFAESGQPLWQALPQLIPFVTGEGARLDAYEKFAKISALLIPTPLDSLKQGILERFSRFLLHLDYLPEQQVLREALARFDFGQENSDAPIQLLTIHQAKGLEFDHVFLPALHKRVGRDDSPLLYTETFYQNNAFHFLLAERKSRGGEGSALYRYLDWVEKQKAHYETMRLLYVAFTRAKQRLFLSAIPEKSTKGSFLSLLSREGGVY